MMTAGWLDELCVPPPVLPADPPLPKYPHTPQEEIASSQRHACHPAMREEARVFVRALRLSDDSKRADVKLTLTLASPPAGRNKHAVLASRVSALLVIGRLQRPVRLLPVLCPTTNSQFEEENRHSGIHHLRKRKSILPEPSWQIYS